MTNANEPATGFSIPGSDKHGWAPETVTGLTKREYFASMAMQGLLSNDEHIKDESAYPKITGKMAVQYADELIKALNEAD